MVFSSVVFLFRFLPVFFICYFLAPGRMKNGILFLGSLFFYAWGEPVYVLLMLFSTLSDYFHGLLLERCRKKSARRAVLCSSVIINLLMLGFFKYADFLIGAWNGITGMTVPLLQLPLPIGISFYTFQTMSYTIDVYRGEVKAQHNLLDFGVFVTMFPQLIAGPIVRYKDVEKRRHKRRINPEHVSLGMQRFCIGLGKKVLLANPLGELWETVSKMEYSGMSAMTAWLGILAFAFQIYFDFSGYSDMAIGLGYMLGFHFPENFRYPYVSTSVTEFWRRWHISLSSWFKEYVYLPLGGSRKGMARTFINIFIVWFLTGLWHGTTINFTLWGLYFCFFLIMEKTWLLKLLDKIPRVFSHIYALVVVYFGWLLFAWEDIHGHRVYMKAMLGMAGAGVVNKESLYLLVSNALLMVIMAIGCTSLPKYLAKKVTKKDGIGASLCMSVYVAVILLLSIAYLVNGTYNPFLYFRF